MILVILTALAAVCGAAKLDKNYLPPISARFAGGSPGALEAPSDVSNQVLGGLPTGSYTNDAQGVVVDAVNPGTRTSGAEPTGLGGPRASYGSTDSKVGDAAFRGSSLGSSGSLTRIAPGFGSFVESDESQADKTSGNTLKFTSDVELENYSYGFETDNGISVGENGVAANGVQAQGGYSYKGDDGKTYSVTYTADEGGYKPQGHHLPTPPPIPDEILKSLKKNAKEEAAGHVDDGTYDAQKYNDEGDYSSNGAGNNNVRPTIGGGAATSSGSYVSQSSQARPTSGVLIGAYNPGSVEGHSSQAYGAQGQHSGNKQSGFGLNKDQSGSLGVSGDSSSIGGQFGQAGSSNPQISNNIGGHSQITQGSQTAFASHSTENRFGVQATKPAGTYGHTQGSVAGSPVRTPSFHHLPGSSASSSAFATGSGSATAFASSTSSNSGLKNEYIPPLNSFGSVGQHTHNSNAGSDSSAGASFPAPSTAIASASVTGTQSQHNNGFQHVVPSVKPQHSTHFPSAHGLTAVSQSLSQGQDSPTVAPSSEFHTHSQSPNLPSSASATASVSENHHSFGQSNQQLAGLISHSNSNAVPSRFGEGQQSGHSATNTEYLPPGSSSFGQTGSQSFNSKPGQYTQTNNKIPSSSGQTQFGSTNTQFTGVKPTQPTLGVDSSHGPTKVPDTDLSTPFESNEQAQSTPAFNYHLTHHTSNSLGSNNIPISSTTPATFISSTHTGAIDASFAPSTQQPAISQPQGNDDSYHYKHPSKPFITPSVSPSSQYPNNREPNFPVNTLSQQGSKYPNTPTTSTSGQYQGTSSSSYSGITQAAISPFTSSYPSSSTQFGSQSSQFVSKPTPSTQFGQSLSSQQTSTQFGATGIQLGQKPIVQSQTQYGQPSSQTSDSSQSPTQQYQGTIYQYNKPAETLSAQGHKETSSSFGQAKPSQILTDSRFGSQQGSSQFGSQSTLQTQSSQGSNTQISQFSQKPIVSSLTTGSNYQQSQFGSSGSQFGQKPATIQGSSYISNTNTQSQQSQFGKKPIGSTQTVSYYQQTTPSVGLSSSSGTQSQTSFGQKPAGSLQTTGFQQTQFGQKPQTTQGSSFTSNTFSQSQTNQFGKKPSGTTQTGSTLQQTQFGSSGSQFGQNSQSAQGSSLASTTSKPFGSSYQQTQFGLTGQKPQTTQGSSFTSNTYTQGQTTQYGKKPVSTTQTGSTLQQNQFGSINSQFGQNSQSTQGSSLASTTSKPFGSSYQQTQFGLTGQKPQTTQGSSFTSNTYTQGQTTQFGKKPVSTTQTGSTLQQNQFGLTGSQFGQNSQSTQGSALASTTSKPFGSAYQQTQFGLTGSQFGQKPQATQGTSFTSNTYTQGQTTQFGKKPVSTTQTGSTLQQNQFGLTGSQFGQNSQSTQGSGLASTTSKPSGSSYQQTQFGLTGSQFGQKLQATQGTSFTSNTYTQGQTTQFGKKPVSTTQTGSTLQQNQFGSINSQFGQNSQSTQGSSLASTTSKPFGSSYQQTQFGLTGSQFGQKPQATQGYSFTSNTYTQGQTTQYGKKPVSTTQTGSTLQQNQFGSAGSQFGQNTQSFGIKPVYQQAQFGSTSSQYSQGQTSQFGKQPVSTTQTGTTFASTGLPGSQFGQKPQTTQGSSFTSNTYNQGQTTQFGKKPVSTTQIGSTLQQNQFGLTGSQIGQNSQSTQGSGLASTTSKPSFGSKPFGSSYQQTQFGSTSNQLGQKQQTTTGIGVTSTTGQKPSSTAQSSSFYQQSQFGSTGSQFGQKPQLATQSSSYTSNSASKGQAVQTSQFGLTGSSQNKGSTSQNTQIGSGLTSQFGQKPQTSQGIIGLNTGSQNQFGQTSQSGNKATGSSSASGSSFQQSQFSSSSGSQFGQSTQTTQGTNSQAQPVQTTQYGIKPFGSSQNTQGSTQFSSTPSRFGQTSQSSQSKVPTLTTISQTVQPTQFGQKPSSFGTYSPSSQFGTQSKQPYGTQTFGSSIGHFGQKPQAQASAFASSSGSNVTPFSSTQTGQGSKYQQTSQLDVQNQGITTTQKPLGSSLSQTNYQQSQYTQTSNRFGTQPQFGQASQSNIGSGQTGGQTTFGAQSQKPFGSQSTQTTYQQTQFNQGQKPSTGAQGSAFHIGQSVGNQLTQSSVQTTSVGGQIGQSSFGSAQSTDGYNYQKPQSVFTTQYGGPQDQNLQQTQTSFNSAVSTSQTSINGQPLKPLGVSSTQGTFQQTQSTAGSSQFGAQPIKSVEISGPIIQTTYNKFSGQPFKPASTTSSLGSSYQSQSSAVSTSQFGLQPIQPADITHFSGQPFQSASTHGFGVESQTVVGSTPQFSVQPTQGIVITTQKPSQSQFSGSSYKPSVFSTTQAPSFPSRVGLNANPEVPVVSTVQTPIVPVPGYEIVTASHGYVGQLEEFGGPRDPPRFDDKTGYHY